MKHSKFSYIIPRGETTTIQVSKEMHRILKMAAKERGLTTNTVVYFALHDGLALMIKKENIKDAELINKIIGFYKEIQERKRRGDR